MAAANSPRLKSTCARRTWTNNLYHFIISWVCLKWDNFDVHCISFSNRIVIFKLGSRLSIKPHNRLILARAQFL